ncbi:MAG: hypothetical protein AABY22_22500, partial [Nanoarchaeota archaeon]
SMCASSSAGPEANGPLIVIASALGVVTLILIIAGFIFGTKTLFIALTGTAQNINTTKTIQRVSGTTMQWRWHMNDTAGNYYTSNTFSVLVADTAGTFTSNITNNTSPKINQNVNFSIVLTDADTLSYRIFSYDNGTGTYTNDSAVLISGTTFNVNVTKTIERVGGTTILWRWFMNDTANNWYVSTAEQLTVANTDATFTNNATNDTSLTKDEHINISITLTDADTLTWYKFSYDNGTGTFTNDSAVTLTGTTQNVNVTKTIDRTRGITIQWRWYINDSASAQNSSSVYQLTVADSATTFTSNTTNNTAPKINEAMQFNITITDRDNISGFFFSWDNGTAFVNDSFRSVSNNITSGTFSVNKTIERVRGTTLQWKWHANDTSGTFNTSA